MNEPWTGKRIVRLVARLAEICAMFGFTFQLWESEIAGHPYSVRQAVGTGIALGLSPPFYLGFREFISSTAIRFAVTVSFFAVMLCLAWLIRGEEFRATWIATVPALVSVLFVVERIPCVQRTARWVDRRSRPQSRETGALGQK
jgi:hypothetical protein